MDHILYVYSSIDAHLGCLRILAIVNDAAVSMSVPLENLLSII